MAISTLDGALAGMQFPQYFAKSHPSTPVAGRPQSLWSGAGNPGAGSFNTSLAGVTLTSPVAGQIIHNDPSSGNAYLGRLQAAGANAGTLLLCDRLWHNGGFTITQTTAQTISSPTWPARDINGATLGDGVYLGLEVSSATGSGTPSITVSYTNSAGTSGKTGTNIDTTASSSGLGSFFRINVAAGDYGVRSVQTLTLGATWTSGVINLVAYRVIASLEIGAANVGNAMDALTSGFPRIYNGSVLFLVFIPATATAGSVSGTYIETQG